MSAFKDAALAIERSPAFREKFEPDFEGDVHPAAVEFARLALCAALGEQGITITRGVAYGGPAPYAAVGVSGAGGGNSASPAIGGGGGGCSDTVHHGGPGRRS